MIAKTLETSPLPYITADISNTPTQHGYKTQPSTVTALHTVNNTVVNGFNQMAPPARKLIVALDISKSFDTLNIHTLIRKLLQAQSLGSSQTTSRDTKSTLHNYGNNTCSQRQFKTGVPQDGILYEHYSTFTLQNYHHPVHRFRSWSTEMTSSSHPHTQARVQPRNTHKPYLHKVFVWTKQNNLTLNPAKTTCTLFTAEPAEYKSNLGLKINKTTIPMIRFWALP